MQESPIENFPSLATPVSDRPAWDEAFVRVESYLRAHHLESRVLLNQVVADIIREARERYPELPPVEAAMNVTHQRIGDWLARAGNAGQWSDVRVRQQGRLSLILGNMPERWSNSFLAQEPVPPELSAALASGVLHASPELRFSNMPPAPLEFGFEDPTDLNRFKRSKLGVVRDAATWLCVLGVFGVTWAASR